MSVELSRRMAGIAGIVFAVLSVLIVIAPPIPTLTASGAEIVSYYANNQTGFLVGNYLGAVALLPAFVLVAYLTVQIRAGEPDGGILWVLVIVANATAFAAAMLVFVLLQAAAVVAPGASPQTAKAFSDAGNMAFGFFFLPQAAGVASVAWGFLVTATMVRWIAWLGLVVAVIQLVASLGTVVVTGPLAAGGPVTLVAFVGFVIWFLLISVVLLVRPAPAARVPVT
jgi:hypothetical protein